MVVNYDMKKINQAMQDFYNSTGINMVLLKEDFSYVGDRNHWENTRYCKAIQNTAKGNAVCMKSDLDLLKKCKATKKVEMHICHAGLVDVAIPILYEDSILGYILFGQMKTDKSFSQIKNYILSLGLDTEEMNAFYNEISSYDSDKIQSISNIATMLAKYILLENILQPSFDERIQHAINFIDKNLEEELSIQIISKNVNISKSVLYKHFHSYLNCTVSEYINLKRIEKSIELMKKTDLSIDEISQKVGFSSVSYYGKIFKKIKKVSPFKYKKLHF